MQNDENISFVLLYAIVILPIAWCLVKNYGDLRTGAVEVPQIRAADAEDPEDAEAARRRPKMPKGSEQRKRSFRFSKKPSLAAVCSHSSGRMWPQVTVSHLYYQVSQVGHLQVAAKDCKCVQQVTAKRPQVAASDRMLWPPKFHMFRARSPNMLRNFRAETKTDADFQASNVISNSLNALIILQEMEGAPWWKLLGYIGCIVVMMGALWFLVSGEEAVCPSNEVDTELGDVLSMDGGELEELESDGKPDRMDFFNAISRSFSSLETAEGSQNHKGSGNGEEEKGEEPNDANC
eukprot:s4747_g4.t1